MGRAPDWINYQITSERIKDMAIEAEAYETMEAFESESESEASEASEAARIRRQIGRAHV